MPEASPSAGSAATFSGCCRPCCFRIIAIAGYLGGPRIGAFVYNLVHNWAFGLAIAGAGLALGIIPLALAGTILIAHTGMDRAAGYGVKLASGFGDTHLGRIGKSASGRRRGRCPGPRAGRASGGRVSPARARTSADAIVGAGRALLERGGLEAVTMQAVADAVGVRAPSLYKRFAGRPALIRAIADDVAAELGAVIAPALEVEDPAEAVRVLADRYRAFAHRSPGAYQLLFTNLLPEANPTPAGQCRCRGRAPPVDRARRRPEACTGGGATPDGLRPRLCQHGAGRSVPARR